MIRAAATPPEERGLARDGVRLLAATPDGFAHATFRDLPRYLLAGDLLVFNTSATVPAALAGTRADGTPVTVHVSTVLDDGDWLVEVRDATAARGRVTGLAAGETIGLPNGAELTLARPYPDPAAARMWVATSTAGDLLDFLAAYGQPVRYSYVPRAWPLAEYQSVFARDPGSAEMPSAARPFTPGLVTDLVAAGVRFAPVTLHAGVASLDEGEPPLPERSAVPQATAELVNLTRAAGRRVVAIGTTVTRALESAAWAPGLRDVVSAPSAVGAASGGAVGAASAANGGAAPRHGAARGAAGGAGVVHAASGWTDLVLSEDNPARVVTGLITGWHDPTASHLALLRAVAGAPMVKAAYAEAGAAGYLWHEFGDSCLLLPPAHARPLAPAGPGTWPGS